MMRMVMKSLALVAVLAAPAAAQQLVPVGVRVRVSLHEDRPQKETRILGELTLRGEVTAESAESLWIRPTRATGSVGISKAGIWKMSRSRGEPSRFGSLMREGIGGAVLGAIEGAVFYHSFGTNYALFGANSREDAAGRGAAYGAVVFGALGFLFPIEYWRRVPLY